MKRSRIPSLSCALRRSALPWSLSHTVCQRSFSSSPRNHIDFTHAVIGGGAVGLAIARALAAKENTTTLLIERHGSVGQETSSRNSEVIHAGLYYGPGTLKTELCVKGKHMLYDLCKRKGIPHRNTMKWILAQDAQQMHELQKLHDHAISIDVPTCFLSRKQITNHEPDVRAEAGVLDSPTTGIIDSHALMAYLEGSFQSRGGESVFHTTVTNIEPIDSSDPSNGYRIHTRPTNDPSAPEDTIDVSTLINSAGLSAIPISNMLLPPSRHRTPYYAKGTYFSYSAPHPRPTTLLYPAPIPGLGGLGTHLTLDLTGRIRFGPDVEWVDSPFDLTPSPDRLAEALAVIKTYLPGIDEDAVQLDYVGIRPKLGRTSGTSGKGFADFYVREEEGFGGFVNLLGIESPGLTSCLAIGEMVRGVLYGR